MDRGRLSTVTMLAWAALLACAAAQGVCVDATLPVDGGTSAVFVSSTGVGLVAVVDNASDNSISLQPFDPLSMALVGKKVSLVPPGQEKFPAASILFAPSMLEVAGQVVTLLSGESGETRRDVRSARRAKFVGGVQITCLHHLVSVANLAYLQSFALEGLTSTRFVDLSNLVVNPPSWNGDAVLSAKDEDSTLYGTE
jgi:hypothetical protein